MKKAKTLLEAATDILLNRSETPIVSEEKKDLSDIFERLEGAIRDLEEQGSYVKGGDFNKFNKIIANLFDEAADIRQLCELNGMLKVEEELEERAHPFEKQVTPILDRIENDINVVGEKFVKGTTYDVSLEYKNLKKSYNVFREAISEELSDDGLSEGTEELDDIAAKVAILKVGDKTNFGQVVSIGGNSVTFKSKDLPKTTIAFKQRKMGSRDYVLTALRKVN